MSKRKNTLDLLFESRARVKILKFLFRNIGIAFTVQELAERIQEPVSLVNKEIKKFLELKLIKVRT